MFLKPRKGWRPRKNGAFPPKEPDDSVPEHVIPLVDDRTEIFLRKKFNTAAPSGLMDNNMVVQIVRECGLNPTEWRAKDLVSEFDYDGDGVSSFNEFIDMYCQLKKEELSIDNTLDLFSKAFSYFDTDCNSSISYDEFRKTLRELGDAMSDEELDSLFKLIDANKDGELSWEEFRQFLQEDKIASDEMFEMQVKQAEREGVKAKRGQSVMGQDHSFDQYRTNSSAQEAELERRDRGLWGALVDKTMALLGFIHPTAVERLSMKKSPLDQQKSISKAFTVPHDPAAEGANSGASGARGGQQTAAGTGAGDNTSRKEGGMTDEDKGASFCSRHQAVEIPSLTDHPGLAPGRPDSFKHDSPQPSLPGTNTPHQLIAEDQQGSREEITAESANRREGSAAQRPEQTDQTEQAAASERR